ncbi:crotonase/enoyl-CoA hydratase family protein [Lichenicola sp.]|uniref:crotonase/enoyl-CoA hydratase family protein n=1 Tax=Lichenicola sp. TaxID=2804529 RepID=UPI003B005B8B
MTLIQSKDSYIPQAPASSSAWPHFAPADVGPSELLATGFETLDVVIDTKRRTLWNFMRPRDGFVCFTPQLLRDMKSLHQMIPNLHEMTRRGGGDPVQYVVTASRIPGIYNLGGDLTLFAEKIRSGNRLAMQSYAHACTDLIYSNSTSFGVPVVTIGLIQGDALGGGFECALAHDVIIAERSAKIGLPEILFNLFPGMGAYSFLSRRLDCVRAEKMILSGRIYTAEELFEMGVVDVLAEDGEGEYATARYIESNARKHNAHTAVYQARRRVKPISEQELRDVVDIWVEAALNLTAADLRKMDRLAAAQKKRVANASGALSQMAAE